MVIAVGITVWSGSTLGADVRTREPGTRPLYNGLKRHTSNLRLLCGESRPWTRVSLHFFPHRSVRAVPLRPSIWRALTNTYCTPTAIPHLFQDPSSECCVQTTPRRHVGKDIALLKGAGSSSGILSGVWPAAIAAEREKCCCFYKSALSSPRSTGESWKCNSIRSRSQNTQLFLTLCSWTFRSCRYRGSEPTNSGSIAGPSGLGLIHPCSCA